jgi:NAD-dependent dihydropyrimidine dehydrogenase PreA subunit
MIYENKKSELQVQDCILCGDCMGSCKKHSLYVVNLKK